MTTLDFLSLDAAERSAHFQPVLRSSMLRRLRDAGAEIEERDGWLVATRIPGEEERELAIRDVTHLYRVEEADGSNHVELGDGAYGVRPPTGHGRTVVARCREGAGSVGDGVLDTSAAWAGFEIAGRGAVTLMRRLTELDLDDLPALGALSHVRALIARPETERFLLFFPQEYGHYLWEVAVDAAKPLGGGPAASR